MAEIPKRNPPNTILNPPPPFPSFIHPSLSLHPHHHHHLPHHPHASKPLSPPSHTTPQNNRPTHQPRDLFPLLLPITLHPLPANAPNHPHPPLFFPQLPHLPLLVHYLPLPVHLLLIPLPPLLPMSPLLPLPLSLRPPCLPPLTCQTQNFPLPLPFLLYPNLLVPNSLPLPLLLRPSVLPPPRETENLHLPLPLLLPNRCFNSSLTTPPFNIGYASPP